jgi:tetratricopeptide (TPR) repeat protein
VFLGEHSKAISVFDLGRESGYTYLQRGMIYLREGKIDSALRYINSAINLESFAVSGLFAKAIKSYIEQNEVEGLKIAIELEKSDPRDSEVLYGLASIYGMFGDKKKCCLLLRRAIEGGFFCYPYMLRDEFLDPVRNDPEFQDVLAVAKKKHETFKQMYFAEIQ